MHRIIVVSLTRDWHLYRCWWVMCKRSQPRQYEVIISITYHLPRKVNTKFLMGKSSVSFLIYTTCLINCDGAVNVHKLKFARSLGLPKFQWPKWDYDWCTTSHSKQNWTELCSQGARPSLRHRKALPSGMLNRPATSKNLLLRNPGSDSNMSL